MNRAKKDQLNQDQVKKDRMQNAISLLVLGVSLLNLACGTQTSDRVEEANSEEVSFPEVTQTPKALPTPLQERSVAESLGIRIRYQAEGGENPDLPAVQQDLSELERLDQFSMEGNEIIVHGRLYLPDPQSPRAENRRRLFFVWSNEALGSRMISVRYTHEILTPNGRRVGNQVPAEVWHDLDRHMRYIPLYEIFRHRDDYAATDIHPDDTQILTLEINLQDGRHEVIRVQFHAVGPLPQLQLVRLSEESRQILEQGSPAIEALIREASRNGKEVLREEVVNPFPREFRLWIKSFESGQVQGAGLPNLRGQAPLRPSRMNLSSVITHPEFSANASSAPGVRENHERSNALFSVDQLRVEHENGEVEEIPLSPQEWSSVVLRPSERLVLKWWAHPVNGGLDCHLHPDQVRQFTWYRWEPGPRTPEQQQHLAWADGHLERAKHGDVFARISESIHRELSTPANIQVPHQVNHTINWKFTEGSLSGSFGRSILISHPFSMEEDAAGRGEREQMPRPIPRPIQHQIRPSLEESLSVVLGAITSHELLADEIHERATPYACQGIFR